MRRVRMEREPARPAGAEGGEHVGERRFEVAQRRRPGIQRGQHVDQDDLPVEPGEMVAEERLHDMRLVGLVAPLHHGGERTPDRTCGPRRYVERREGQRGRALQVAGHEEAAGRQHGQERARRRGRCADNA